MSPYVASSPLFDWYQLVAKRTEPSHAVKWYCSSRRTAYRLRSALLVWAASCSWVRSRWAAADHLVGHCKGYQPPQRGWTVYDCPTRRSARLRCLTALAGKPVNYSEPQVSFNSVRRSSCRVISLKFRHRSRILPSGSSIRISPLDVTNLANNERASSSATSGVFFSCCMISLRRSRLFPKTVTCSCLDGCLTIMIPAWGSYSIFTPSVSSTRSISTSAPRLSRSKRSKRDLVLASIRRNPSESSLLSEGMKNCERLEAATGGRSGDWAISQNVMSFCASQTVRITGSQNCSQCFRWFRSNGYLMNPPSRVRYL